MIDANIRNNFTIIAPIFAPNKEGFDIQLASIKSLFNYTKHHNIERLNIVFGGYCKEQEYWDTLLHYCILKPHNIMWRQFFDNYGKAKVVNTLFKEFCSTKYFFTYDSDILFDIDEKDIFTRCYNIAEQIPTFGLIGLAQLDNDCQLHSHYTQDKTVMGELLRWHPGNGGIAGGCFYGASKAFKEVNGYRETGVYSSDDGCLTSDIGGKEFFVAMASTINVIHPYTKELKPGYNEWKYNILRTCRTNGAGVYNENFKKTMEFWNG